MKPYEKQEGSNQCHGYGVGRRLQGRARITVRLEEVNMV